MDYTFIGGTPDPVVCHYNGSSWSNGSYSIAGGSVAWNGQISFSPFAVGDKNYGAVPVSISAFKID